MASLSLRPLVIDSVQSFAEAFGPLRQAVSEAMVEMIVGVSNYREEGLSFAPLVFVTADLAETLARVHGSDPIVIGSDPNATAAARFALRSCAPLGEGRRWAIFLHVGPEGVEFGLFRPENSPLRPTSFELLRRSRGDDRPTVGLTQLRNGVVEIRSSAGFGRYLDFSGSPEQTTEPGYVVSEFVSAVTSEAPKEIRAQLEAFYYRLGVEILTGDHGALAAVLAPKAPPPGFLGDGIWLRAPVDLGPWIERDNVESSSDGTRALFAYAQLIRRMTMMDGITVFGTDGTVRAYACFVREAAAHAGPSTYVAGGARRRTYDYLRAHLGTELVAVLYRSQDGAADCAVASSIASIAAPRSA